MTYRHQLLVDEDGGFFDGEDYIFPEVEPEWPTPTQERRWREDLPTFKPVADYVPTLPPWEAHVTLTPLSGAVGEVLRTLASADSSASDRERDVFTPPDVCGVAAHGQRAIRGAHSASGGLTND